LNENAFNLYLTFADVSEEEQKFLFKQIWTTDQVVWGVPRYGLLALLIRLRTAPDIYMGNVSLHSLVMLLTQSSPLYTGESFHFNRNLVTIEPDGGLRIQKPGHWGEIQQEWKGLKVLAALHQSEGSSAIIRDIQLEDVSGKSVMLLQQAAFVSYRTTWDIFNMPAQRHAAWQTLEEKRQHLAEALQQSVEEMLSLRRMGWVQSQITTLAHHDQYTRSTGAFVPFGFKLFDELQHLSDDDQNREVRNVKHRAAIHANIRGAGHIVDGGSVLKERGQTQFIQAMFELVLLYSTAGINDGLSDSDIITMFMSVKSDDQFEPWFNDVKALFLIITGLRKDSDILNVPEYKYLVRMLEERFRLSGVDTKIKGYSIIGQGLNSGIVVPRESRLVWTPGGNRVLSVENSVNKDAAQSARSNMLKTLTRLCLQEDISLTVLQSYILEIGRIGGQEAVNALDTLWQDRKNGKIVDSLEVIVQSLGRIGSEAALKILLRMYEAMKEESFVRVEIIKMLGKIGGKETLVMLERILKTATEIELIVQSVQALRDIGTTDALAVLYATLYGVNDPHVYKVYVEAFGEMGGSKELHILKYIKAIDYILKFIKVFKKEDVDLLISISLAWIRLGGDRLWAENILNKMRGETNSQLLGRIGVALEEIGSSSDWVVDVLEEQSKEENDQDKRVHLISSLSRLNNERVLGVVSAIMLEENEASVYRMMAHFFITREKARSHLDALEERISGIIMTGLLRSVDLGEYEHLLAEIKNFFTEYKINIPDNIINFVRRGQLGFSILPAFEQDGQFWSDERWAEFLETANAVLESREIFARKRMLLWLLSIKRPDVDRLLVEQLQRSLTLLVDEKSQILNHLAVSRAQHIAAFTYNLEDFIAQQDNPDVIRDFVKANAVMLQLTFDGVDAKSQKELFARVWRSKGAVGMALLMRLRTSPDIVFLKNESLSNMVSAITNPAGYLGRFTFNFGRNILVLGTDGKLSVLKPVESGALRREWEGFKALSAGSVQGLIHDVHMADILGNRTQDMAKAHFVGYNTTWDILRMPAQEQVALLSQDERKTYLSAAINQSVQQLESLRHRGWVQAQVTILAHHDELTRPAGEFDPFGFKLFADLERDEKSGRHREMRYVKHNTIVHANVRGEGFIVDGGSIEKEMGGELKYIRSMFELVLMYMTAGINNRLSNRDILDILASVLGNDKQPLFDDEEALFQMLIALRGESDIVDIPSYKNVIKMLEEKFRIASTQILPVADGNNISVLVAPGSTQGFLLNDQRLIGTGNNNPAQTPGGIDFKEVNADVAVATEGAVLTFEIDPALREHYTHTAGFSPTLFDFHFKPDVLEFLGMALR
jgi:hypothetical protein